MSTAYEYATVPTPAGPRPRLSRWVRPAPPLEPPLDPPDDQDDDARRRRLRLVSAEPAVLPFAPSATRVNAEARARGASAGRGDAADEDQFWGPQPTSRTGLPDPGRFARQFLQATLEALHGRRPPTQLRRWASSSLYADLARAAARSAGNGRSSPPSVKSVRVCEPVDGVAEVSAVIAQGGRCRAVAARLEGIDGRWRCVHLQIG